MKVFRIIKMIMGHICIICSLALLGVQILDWYNPFMDFMGHSAILLYLLCISSIFLGLVEIYGKTPKTARFSYRRHGQRCQRKTHNLTKGVAGYVGNQYQGIFSKK